MTIAIIGAGEVGQAYAGALVGAEAGVDLLAEVALCDPRPGQAVLDLARHGGVTLHRQPAEWLADAAQVWLAVTGDLTLAVLDTLLPWVGPGALVVDLTTASPGDKREGALRTAAAGGRYVDAVILGAIALTGARTPVLAVGPYAPVAMEVFSHLGATVTCLPDAAAGDAASLKLLRTILTKGLEALAVECLVVAEQQGIRHQLYDAMSDVDAIGFTGFLDMLVRTHVVHATRRQQEIQRATAQLTSLGHPASMLQAGDGVFSRTVALAARHPAPLGAATDVSVALGWLSEAGADLTAAEA